MTKKLILTIIMSIFSLHNMPYAFAEQIISSGDQINEIANRHAESNNEEPDNSAPKQKDIIGNMLLQAVSLMGIPYKWGGNNPETGMDCSGLIRYVYQKSFGINLPRTAAEMAKVGKRISIDDIQPGDLLFFNTRGFNSSHIGLYLGNNQFLQSQKTGTDIQITELKGYWREKFNGAKRIVEEDENNPSNIQTYADVRNEPLVASHITRKKRKATHRRSTHKTTAGKGTIKPTTNGETVSKQPQATIKNKTTSERKIVAKKKHAIKKKVH